jgi:hypothetical protein
MNNARRTKLEKIRDRVEELREELREVENEEQEAFDNIPENLQYAERGQMMQSAIDSIQTAADGMDEAFNELEIAMQ